MSFIYYCYSEKYRGRDETAERFYNVVRRESSCEMEGGRKRECTMESEL